MLDVDVLAKATAATYAVNEIHFDAVMNCESGGDLEAVGDHGLAYGPFQWHQASFDWLQSVAVKRGEPFQNLEYKNPKDQITLAAWAFANGQIIDGKYVSFTNQWSCYSIEKNKDWK